MGAESPETRERLVRAQHHPKRDRHWCQHTKACHFPELVPEAIGLVPHPQTNALSIRRIFVGLSAVAENSRNQPLFAYSPIGKLTLEMFHNSVSHYGIPLVGQADERWLKSDARAGEQAPGGPFS